METTYTWAEENGSTRMPPEKTAWTSLSPHNGEIRLLPPTHTGGWKLDFPSWSHRVLGRPLQIAAPHPHKLAGTGSQHTSGDYSFLVRPTFEDPGEHMISPCLL